MDVPFIGAPSACCLGGLLPTQWQCTPIIQISSMQNTNAQLLNFDVTTWVIDLPVHDMNLAFSNTSLPAKASTSWSAF